MRVRSHTKGAVAQRSLRKLRARLLDKVESIMCSLQHDSETSAVSKVRLEIARELLGWGRPGQRSW